MPPLRANKNGMKKEKLDFKMLKKLFKYGKKYRFAIIVSMFCFRTVDWITPFLSSA